MSGSNARMILGLIVVLIFGFVAGYAVRGISHRHAIAASVPIHRMPSTNGYIVAPNELVAPDVWRVALDPLWTPNMSPAEGMLLPEMIHFPAAIPQVQTTQTDKDIRVTAQVPGLTLKDVDIQVSKDVLSIKGEKVVERNKDKSFQTVQESFVQTVKLPCKVDGDRAKATIKDGVLTVLLPKTDGAIAQGQGSKTQ